MQDAVTNKCPLTMTFLDLKNAFGSVPHRLMFNIFHVSKFATLNPFTLFRPLQQQKLGKLNQFH